MQSPTSLIRLLLFVFVVAANAIPLSTNAELAKRNPNALLRGGLHVTIGA